MPASAKVGRPAEVDPRHIAQVALRLFERKGFDAVTMDEVAKAASVSRRTLFRYFPSKSDLVWFEVHDILRELRKITGAMHGRKLGLRGIVRELFVPILTTLDDPAAANLARRRLRLMARAPTLLNHPAVHEIEALLASVIAARGLPKKTPAPLAARSLVAATFASLSWWAEHGDDLRARDATLGALQAIAVAME